MNYQDKTREMIQSDQWMMDCLNAAADLQLEDWYIGAGFVRNKIWDVMHGYDTRTPLNDVDVVYFDKSHYRKSSDKDSDKATDLALEQKLLAVMPGINWSVINLAYIHLRYDQQQFEDSTHAISYWPELPTCIGVRLEDDGQTLSFTEPWGIENNFSLEVKPNLNVGLSPEVYAKRIADKQWDQVWPQLQISTGVKSK
ncbi:MAG: nucleotidyltransferase family protein [Algicola sp.]|nr:nucleotidyltransferase family protein [Algicola sp.]